MRVCLWILRERSTGSPDSGARCNNLIYRRALESQRTKGTAMEQLRLFSLEETISYTPAMEQLRLR